MKFREAYMKRFDDYPRLGSVVGYTTLKTIAKAIAAAGSTEAKAFLEAMSGLEVLSPLGPVTFRAADQQSTMGTSSAA